MFLILLLYMILASTFTMGKAVLCYISPIFFIALRMLVGGGLLYAYLIVRKQRILPKRADLLDFLQIIAFHIYCAYIFEFWALQYVSSSKTALIYNISPFVTALFAWFMLREYLTKNKLIGLIIGLIGIVPWIITKSECGYFTLAGRENLISLPEIILIVAVISSAYGWIIFKRLMHKGYSPLMINTIGMLGGGLCALMTSLLFEKSPRLLSNLSTCPVNMPGLQLFTSWFGSNAQIALIAVYMLLMILISNIIFYNLYGLLLQRYSATFLSFAGFTCPLFAALFGWLYLGESVGWNFFISAAIISCGLLIFYQEELKLYTIKK